MENLNLNLNFNELAWKAPEIDENRFGYKKGHKYYDAICEWLKSGTKLWKTVNEEKNEVTTRVTWDGMPYDAIVTFYKNDTAIYWTFRKKGTFCID